MNEVNEIIEITYPGKLFVIIRVAVELLGLNVDKIYNRRSKGRIRLSLSGSLGKMMVPISELIRLAE